MKHSRKFIESISRGFGLLSAISESASPLTLTELSEMLQLSKSTIQRLTYTLQNLQLLDRDKETMKFLLGPKMISIALSVVQDLDLSKVAIPYMRDTAKDTGETIGIAVLSGSDIVYTNYVKSRNVLNIELRIGDRFAAHCTSMGRAILAFLPGPQLEDVIQNVKFVRFTPNTIMRKKDLVRELSKVRTRGFSTNDEETHLGVRSVAAPVRNSASEVIAAVNVIVPCIRASKKTLETILAKKVMDLADKISLVMGYRNDSP